MKYIFIDTNVFIQCCLLELEGDDLNSLKELNKLLDNNNTKLLLPEALELEFYKALNYKSKNLRNKIGKYKAQIEKDGKGKIIDEKVKNDIIAKLDECIQGRDENTKNVKKEIKKIFSHKNSIRILLDIEIFIRSYKYFLSGQKPYNVREKSVIQVDCIILESLRKFLDKKKNYELYFCSNNTSDFAENIGNEKFNIHKEIKEKFPRCKTLIYGKNLFRLLKDNFNAKYTAKSIEKLDKVDTSVFISPSYSDAFSHFCSKCGKVFFGGMASALSGQYLCSECSGTGILSGVNTISSEDIGLDLSSINIDNQFNLAEHRLCSKCGTIYLPQDFSDVNNVCPNCNNNQGIYFNPNL